MSILLKDALIITQNEERAIVTKDIFIDDNRIEEIGDHIPVESSYTIKGNKLVMPGLINTHTHLPMSLMRGYGDDLPLERWLHEKIWPVEQQFDDALVAAGTRLSLLEMIVSGTTCHTRARRVISGPSCYLLPTGGSGEWSFRARGTSR